tara:strand:- start:3155 stop:3601 length:447 start_codon:yes stop_codon:yes gene_type:complete
MNFKTHILFAFLIVLYTKDYFHGGIGFVILVVIGSLLPDLDETKSYLGQRVFLIPWLSKLLFGHRGVYHSILFGLGIGYLVNLVVGYVSGVALFIGYVSHLIMDGLTKEGVALFWPLKWKMKGFVKTGSFLENVIFGIVFILILAKII